jgi:uncharacterized membrane protein YhdT
MYSIVTALLSSVLLSIQLLIDITLSSYNAGIRLQEYGISLSLAVILVYLFIMASCCWLGVMVLPETSEILLSSEKKQKRKFSFSLAAIITVLAVILIWQCYLIKNIRALSGLYRANICLFTVIIFIILIYFMRRIAFDSIERIEALIDKQYQGELLNFMQIIRSQRHDFSFHMQAISGMIENKKYSECDEYIKQMVENTSVMNEVLPLHDPAVSAMLNSFRELAAQKDIELEISIRDNLQHIPCTVYEINTVIGNLIKNAIDELDQNREYKPWIRVLILKRGGNDIIKITNECNRDTAEFRDIFKPGYSTKQSHEGIGLTTVQRIVTKYGGTVYPEFEEKTISFIVQLPIIY